MNAFVLRVEGLRVSYDHPAGAVRAVDDVSFSLRPHERFGLAGESGSGKSTMALAILRLIRPPGHIDGGEVWLEDTRLSALSDEAMARRKPQEERSGPSWSCRRRRFRYGRYRSPCER